MNDLEICKRIAEIEGLSTLVFNGVHLIEREPFESCESAIFYNPLTDDALCFQLMVKYKVKIVFERAPDYYHAIGFYKDNTKFCESDENPNKAICLAIIEAHK